KHIALAAVRLQLDLQAVVGEPAQPHREQGLAQLRADLGGQLGVGASAEHRDLPHADQARPSPPGDCGYLRQSRVLSCASCRAAWRSQRRGLARAAAVPPARAARVTTVTGAGTPSAAGPSPGSPLPTWPPPADPPPGIPAPPAFPVREVSSSGPSPVMTRSAPARARSSRASRPSSSAPGTRTAPQAAASP